MAANWIPIGKAENAGEERVFNYLKQELPEDYTFFSNASITDNRSRTFEYDAIVLAPHAIYAVEVKDWSGPIRGNHDQWELPDGATRRNPLPLIEQKARVLKSKINIGKVWVQECVCLGGQSQPRLQINDDEKRLKKVHWYKYIIPYLTNKSALSKYKKRKNIDSAPDITPYHEQIREIIDPSRPGPKRPLKLGSYVVQEEAWVSEQYYAYYARLDDSASDAYLLKIYLLPENFPEDKREQLRREFHALDTIKSKGDPQTAGSKHVVIAAEEPIWPSSRVYAIPMEWVDGELLINLLEENKLSFANKYDVAAQLCRGLAYAHSAQIIHRNLSPANIIRANDGLVKLINFDFAKFMDPEVPVHTIKNVKLEQKYVAPEIFAANDYHVANSQTDIYSLGLIIWEMFVGYGAISSPQERIEIGQIKEMIPDDDQMTVDILSRMCSHTADQRQQSILLEAAEHFEEMAYQIGTDVGTYKRVPDLKPHVTFASKYRILRCLRSTQMSTVYLAVDNLVDELVVVKFLTPDEKRRKEEFKRAYDILHQIDTAYTAKWIDHGLVFVNHGDIVTKGGQQVYYQVFEYVKGKNLQQYLQRQLPEPEEALAIMTDVLKAVSAVHKVGWIHRDIKPENFIYTPRGQTKVKIIDFGVSKRVEDVGVTQVGNWGYFPLEVLSGKGWSLAGDLYSAAGVFAALLCGEAAGSANGPVRDWKLIEEKVGQKIKGLIYRNGHQKSKPGDRHNSAMEFLSELEESIVEWETSRLSQVAEKPDVEDESMNEAVKEYEGVIEKLEKLAQEKRLEGENEWATEIEADLERLHQWVTDGLDGPCPIDLAQYDIHISESQPALASEPSSNGAETLTMQITETPEQLNLRRQLDEAHTLFEQEAYQQVLGLTGSLEQQAIGLDLADEIADLRYRAQQAFDEQLNHLLAEGDKARERDDSDSAREYYNQVLELDMGNQHAHRALLELERDLSQQLTQAELSALSVGLREKRDVKRLGDAVYRAEAFEIENKLTDELVQLLREAREAYNQLRYTQGTETTMMRLGDLEARKKAREQIEKRVLDNEPNIFDATTNRFRPTFEVLAEASELYRRSSEETAQYEIDRIRNALPAHPLWASERLREALSKPFYEEHKRQLNAQLDEVERLITLQEQAEGLLKQADTADDPVATFRLVLQAFHAFEYLPGLAERVAQSRQTALETLAAQIRRHYRQVETLLQGENFQAARDEINRAATVAARWPETDESGQARIPDTLQNLLLEGNDLNDKINHHAERRQEFDRLAQKVRERVTDPAMRQAGLADLQALNENDSFKGFPALQNDLALLNSEIDQYKGISLLLNEAEVARHDQQWERVRELALKMGGTGKLGQFATQVDEWLEEATIELALVKAKSHLTHDEIDAAKEIYDGLFATYEPRVDSLRTRLDRELQVIDQAMKDSPAMGQIFNQAVKWQERGDEWEQLAALQMFQFVGGDTMVSLADNWLQGETKPQYALSRYTAEARHRARQLSDELRESLLSPLVVAYEKIEQEGEEQLDAVELRVMAGRAQALHGARLLSTERERTAVRQLRLRQAQLDAQAEEGAGNWDKAVDIWQGLYDQYPLFVKDELYRARIQQTISQSRKLSQQNRSDEALAELQAAEAEFGLMWQIVLALADVYAAKGEFDRAFNTLRRAERHPQGADEAAKKRRELQREQVIERSLERAELALQNSSPREALQILQATLRREVTQDSLRIQRMAESVFAEAETHLLEKAQAKREVGSDEGKIEAVVALVDLKALEDLIERPENERRAARELIPLRTELKQVAEAVIEEAETFNPIFLSLEQALSQSEKLSSRLQTFTNVLPLFDEELRAADLREGLEHNRKDIGTIYDKLKQLEALLSKADHIEQWQQALITDNFDTLQQYGQQIMSLQLNQMLRVRHFTDKLSEWREIHTYLMQAIARIRRLFAGEEAFAEVRRELRRLRSRPDVRPDNNQAWQQLQQREYEQIYQVMSNKLRIDDLYSETGEVIAGWAAVEQAATERQEELEAWEQWDRVGEGLMDRAGTAVAITDNHDDMSLTEKYQNWENVQTAAQRAVEHLSTDPIIAESVGSVRSGKAEAFEKEGKRRQQISSAWLHEAETHMETIVLDFPTAENFNNATVQKNWVLLGNFIKQAEIVGPSNDEEKKRLNTYKRVYEQHIMADKKESFLKRLIGRFT